jgi:hypothetical protein
MTALVLCLLAAPGDAAFEKHVRPVLLDHCIKCHGPKKQNGGLRLDSRAALLKGGGSGPAVVPGKPEDSLLIKAVRHDGELKMPKSKKLPAPAIDALAAWVKAGAPWPDERPIVSAEAWRKHWAFRPVKRLAVPGVAGGRNPIDRFLLAAQRKKGLAMSPEAPRETLLRRASFVLTGLPPTPEELAAFLSDRRPDAYERLVQRLLASPAHGEHLARPWLDVARFADTKGYVFFEEAPFPWAWTYRDYVIESFNAGLPYDRFLKEQLAADLLPGGDRRSLRALGFVTLGGRFMNNPHDILDDRIDATTRGLMGLTVSCARCHDHKFDPLSSADYYALYGVFASCEEVPVPPEYGPAPATDQYRKFAVELAKREKALFAFLEGKRAALVKSARVRAGEYLLAVHARRGQPVADDFMLLADPGDLNPAMINRWQAYLVRAPSRIWGPWREYAALPKEKFAEAARSVVIAKDTNTLVARLFATPPTSLADVASRYGKLLNDIEKASPPKDADARELRGVFHGPGAPPDLTPGLFSELELLPDRAAQGELQKLRKPVEQWRATGPGAPPRAHALRDRVKLYEPVVFRRGNPATPGERVTRRFPTFLGGKAFTKGAGRLELAEVIASKDNPLTARVMANRLWLVAFGRGLVDTPGDFGLRAAPPAHPELLDFLADELLRSGWDVKHLLRLIVTSAAFRQAGGAPPKADPDNALLSRFPRRRLTLEQLRDSLLVMSGQLDRHIGGPSVKGEMGPGVRRRTLYSHVDRIYVSGLFRSFDFPSPDASSPERSATLVPQQALFLMNSPFALHAARQLAARTAPLKGEVRVSALYRIAYGRGPSDDERKLALAFIRADADWAGYAHALLLANEFTFLE